MSCRLSVNVREFILTDEHATTVSDEILDATRGGGAYVHITPISGPEADVLVTPATTITFERITSVQPSVTQPETSWHLESWPDDYS